MRFFTPFLFLLLPLIAFPEKGSTSELAEGPPLSLIQRAEQGDADAQFSLGVAYDNGQGVPQDDREAAKWYRRAAEQGYLSAQYNLGVMYANGRGVPQDYKEAYAWFNVAAAKGDKDAASSRDRAARQLDSKALSEAQALSRTYYDKYR